MPIGTQNSRNSKLNACDMIFVLIADIHWDDCLTLIDSLCTSMLNAIPILKLKVYRPQEGVEQHRLTDGLGVKS